MQYKNARIIAPHRTHGGFQPLCEALRNEPWGKNTVTVGSKLADTVPDLVIVSMGTPRAAVFGISQLVRLHGTEVPHVGIFSTVELMRSHASSAELVRAALGNRLSFAVLLGLDQSPTGWNVPTIRLLPELTATGIALVANEFLRCIAPKSEVTELIVHEVEPPVVASR